MTPSWSFSSGGTSGRHGAWRPRQASIRLEIRSRPSNAGTLAVETRLLGIEDQDPFFIECQLAQVKRLVIKRRPMCLYRITTRDQSPSVRLRNCFARCVEVSPLTVGLALNGWVDDRTF